MTGQTGYEEQLIEVIKNIINLFSNKSTARNLMICWSLHNQYEKWRKWELLEFLLYSHRRNMEM